MFYDEPDSGAPRGRLEASISPFLIGKGVKRPFDLEIEAFEDAIKASNDRNTPFLMGRAQVPIGN